MKISNFIICIDGNANAGECSVRGILSAISPEYVPGMFSFSIYMTILDLSEGIHSLKILMKDFDNEEILEANGELNYTPDQMAIPSEYKGVNGCVELKNVVFKKSGEYIIDLFIDGNLEYSKSVFVKGKNELYDK